MLLGCLGYANADVNQQVKPYNIAPKLAADTSDNYPVETIDITFNTDAKWSDGISQVSINGETISSSDYKVGTDKLTFDAKLFKQIGNYYINVKSNFYLEANVVQTIIERIVGVDNVLSNLNFKVFPNPSTGIFNVIINDESETSNYSVLNLQGQQIISGRINRENHVIDL